METYILLGSADIDDEQIGRPPATDGWGYPRPTMEVLSDILAADIVLHGPQPFTW